jgi:indolepyruvate ferredoxin oxidoreductase
MGGEGTPWVGQAPFTTERHIFANLGDGTYNHSGLLAIRQAIAAKSNITYKILFNGAVAMTGGQPVDGGMSVAAMTRELEAEGVRRIFVVTDAPDAYEGAAGLAPGVEVRHRDELERVQKLLREEQGVTAIIYEQECATKKRRERKRGKRKESTARVLINELVCEGCGDCSTQSNCLAVRPVETEFGRKRRIDQGTCNTDLSCLKGFCPSFVTVEGGKLRATSAAVKTLAADVMVPEPALPGVDSIWGIIVAGVGGTGVVTIGQVLGMAAHLEGKTIVTQDATGMAQMGGATWSHVQIAPAGRVIPANRVGALQADLVLGCDPMVTASDATLAVLDLQRSWVVLNSHVTPTASFMSNPDWQAPREQYESKLRVAVGTDHLRTIDADAQARRLVGGAVFGNMLLLGYAWQLGRVPLSHSAILRAIELNGVQAEKNKEAFEAGRRCAADPEQAVDAGGTSHVIQQVIQFVRPPDLASRIAARHAFLADYQDRRYADSYRDFVDGIARAEALIGGTRLADAVARNLFKLMAYKDEYEVARLHSGAEFRRQIADTFEGDFKVVHHLAPPMFSRRNDKGELVKRRFGPWIGKAMSLLAPFKFLRGTPFDVFGYTEERKTERQSIAEYRSRIEALAANLTKQNLQLAVKIASLPESIRGFGHVKERNLAAARAEGERLMTQWQDAIAHPQSMENAA